MHKSLLDRFAAIVAQARQQPVRILDHLKTVLPMRGRAAGLASRRACLTATGAADGPDTDLLTIGLRPGYEVFDFVIPLVPGVLERTGAVQHRRLSDVRQLTMRKGSSLDVGKCIYARLPSPPDGDAFERGFMQWMQTDGSVEAFCRIDPDRHDFMAIDYLKDDGTPATSTIDFIVRTGLGVYLVQTSAMRRPQQADAQRERRAMATWCARINLLREGERGARQWHCLWLTALAFRDWQCDGARLADLLEREAGTEPSRSA